MTRSDADENEPTAALELAEDSGELTRTEVLHGELLDTQPAPEPASEGPTFAATVAPAPNPSTTEQPTVRWGALVWALLFGSVGAFALWTLVDPARRDDAVWWAIGLHPTMAVLYGLIAVGVIVALFGIVGLIRRGERKRRAARG